MSRVRSKWTSPEKVVHNQLKGLKIRHKMHPPLPGNPDVYIKGTRKVVFIHGCFWHKCSVCAKPMPASRKEYWEPHIQKSVDRDVKSEALLTSQGWEVIRIWEHEVNKDLSSCMARILGE